MCERWLLGGREPAVGAAGDGSLDQIPIQLAEVAAVGGTWIAKSADMREGRWSEIAAKARAAVTKAKELRP